jgi:hypothetical protein
MKVYLICKGDTDYCATIGISSTEEKAMKAISVIKNSGKIPNIFEKPEEIEIDGIDKFVLLLEQNYKQYYYYMYRDGHFKIEEEKLYHFINSKFYFNNAHLAKKVGMESSVFLRGIIWALSPEKAIEVVNNKRLEMIERGEW